MKHRHIVGQNLWCVPFRVHRDENRLDLLSNDFRRPGRGSQYMADLVSQLWSPPHGSLHRTVLGVAQRGAGLRGTSDFRTPWAGGTIPQMTKCSSSRRVPVSIWCRRAASISLPCSSRIESPL